jgi:hypothetical protein
MWMVKPVPASVMWLFWMNSFSNGCCSAKCIGCRFGGAVWRRVPRCRRDGCTLGDTPVELMDYRITGRCRLL